MENASADDFSPNMDQSEGTWSESSDTDATDHQDESLNSKGSVTADEPRSKPPQTRPDICIACARGNYPAGGHQCSECGKNVHIFLGCSVAVPNAEEGYGQPRLCIACNAKHVMEEADVAGARVFENWCNQVVLDNEKKERKRRQESDAINEKTSKKKALYTGKNKQKIKDMLACQPHQSLPILKNGNDPDLQPNTIDKKLYSLRNTCAFDSLYQILLANAVDNENFRELVSKYIYYKQINFSRVWKFLN